MLSGCPKLLKSNGSLLLYSHSKRHNWFRTLLSRKKPFDPRVGRLVTPRQRAIRKVVITSYFAFWIFLFVPGQDYDANTKTHTKFFEENSKLDDINVLESGLQYRILEKGFGQRPTSRRSEVSVHLQGSLLNGTMFTTTEHRETPLKLTLDTVIPGFAEALLRMNVGSEFEIFIPSHLAYGRLGKIGAVPPNTPIVFKVQLTSVNNHVVGGPPLAKPNN